MYSEYPPSPLLAPYIDKFWEFKGNPEYGMRIHILPDGCTDFIFTLGEVAKPVGHCLVMQPYQLYFVGPMTTYSELVCYSETVHMLGIRFLPGGVSPFMRLPLYELTNQRINTHEITSFFDRLFIEKINELPDLRTRIEAIEKLFLHALRQNQYADPQMIYAIRQIHRQHGQQSIHSLATEVCLCQRHFERKFKQYTGYTPKTYSRIIKFRHSIDLMQRSACPDLLAVSTAAGYYDISHFIKELKTFSGHLPSSFLDVNLPEDTSLTYL